MLVLHDTGQVKLFIGTGGVLVLHNTGQVKV